MSSSVYLIDLSSADFVQFQSLLLSEAAQTLEALRGRKEGYPGDTTRVEALIADVQKAPNLEALHGIADYTLARTERGLWFYRTRCYASEDVSDYPGLIMSRALASLQLSAEYITTIHP